MAITITTATPLPPATVGVFYSVTLDRTGGIAPFSWSATDIPAGLVIGGSGSSTTISGTPTAAANPAEFTIFVESFGGSGDTGQKDFTLVINPDPSANGSLQLANSGDKIDHGSGATLDDLPNGAFTIWAWIMRTEDNGSGRIFSKTDAYPNGWLMVHESQIGNGAVQFIVFRSADFSLATNYQTVAGVIPLNQLCFIALTYDNAATPKVHIYSGGEFTSVTEASYALQTNGSGSPTGDGSANLLVGNDQSDLSKVFHGRMYETGIIGRALSQAQLEAIRKSSLTNANVADTKLLARYTSTGSQTDYSGNGNTGTSTGATVAAGVDFFAITNPSLPSVQVGGAYNQQIGVIRGTAPYTSATISAGNLPSGINIALENTQGVEIAAKLTATSVSAAAGDYTFTVRLVGTDGYVATKQFTITVTAPDSTAPTVPTGLTPTVISSSQINLAWNASTDNTGVTGYDLQRATDAAFTQNLTTINLGNVLNYSDTGRTASTQYFYRVRAHDAIPNNSAYSSSVSATTFGTETVLTVDASTAYQTLDGFGATLLSNQYGLISEYDSVPDAQGRTGATRDNLTTAQRTEAIEKAFNQVKINIGYAEQQIFQNDANNPDFRELDFFFPNLITPALAYSLGTPILASSIDLRGGIPYLNSARTANYSNYLVLAGQYIVNFANRWRTNAGKAKTDPLLIWLFNEPLNGNTELGAGGTVQEVIDLIKSCGNALVADGYTNAKFIVPNAASEATSLSLAQSIVADAQAKAFIYALGYHPYPYSQGYSLTSNILATSGAGNPESALITVRNQLRDLAAANGLKLWMSEVSNGHIDNNANTAFGTIGALRARAINIHDDLLYANAGAWFPINLIWDEISSAAHFNDGGASFYQEGDAVILVDQRLPSGQQVLIGDSGYAIGHYARWVKPGAVRVNATSPDSLIQISAFKKNGKHSFVLINNNSTSKTVRVQLSGADTFTSTLEGESSYLTNRWQAIATPPITNGNSFVVTLPPNSVTSVANINTTTLPDTEPPSNVGTPTATAVSTTVINLSYPSATDNTAVANYEIQYALNNSFTVGLNTTTSPSTSLDIGTLTPATAYFFRVKAVDDALNESVAWSPTATATTFTTPPTPPAILLDLVGCELYVEPSLNILVENAAVTNLPDYSDKGRNLTASANQPIYKNNILNTRSMVRYSGSNNPLANAASFQIACGWIVCKYNGANFDNYRGLLTGVDAENQEGDILVSNNIGTKFFYFSNEFYEYRKDDRIYPADDAPAPMNQFALIFFRFWKPITVVGIQIGQQRQFTTRRWNGDVGLVALFSRNFCESEIRANTQIIADYYAFSLADVYPYQADKSSPEQSEQLTSFYDPPEGSRISEDIGESKRILDLEFSSRRQKEVKAMQEFHKEHYANGMDCIYRDYKFIPPEDIEGYIDSKYDLDGAVNNFKYSFKFKEK